MAYEQAQIPVQKAEDFEQLRSAIDRIFSSSPALEKFYRRLEANEVRAREFEKVAALRLLEEADPVLAGCGKSADEIYRSLAVSDQALLREFYLERLERVDAKLRLKHQKVYRYY
jgi:hypothetical protein